MALSARKDLGARGSGWNLERMVPADVRSMQQLLELARQAQQAQRPSGLALLRRSWVTQTPGAGARSLDASAVHHVMASAACATAQPGCAEGGRRVLQVGPHICCLKTHVDIFDSWSTEAAARLRRLADKHGAPGPLGAALLRVSCWQQQGARPQRTRLAANVTLARRLAACLVAAVHAGHAGPVKAWSGCC